MDERELYNADGTPKGRYLLRFADGTDRKIDLADGDDWGNVKRFCDLFGENGDGTGKPVEVIGFGGECEGYKPIVSVEGVDRPGEAYRTRDEIRWWWSERVCVYSDWHSGN